MIRKRQPAEEDSNNAPAYLVTFSDMVTLLLTFFVMLQTLAIVQDEALFKKGRDSFVETIGKLGLGMLFGKGQGLDFGHSKIKYFIIDSDEAIEGRTIDAKQQKIRRIFHELNRTMTTLPSQLTEKKSNFSVTDIHFGPNDASLNGPAKKFLTQFALNLRHNSDSANIRLCVLGLAADAESQKEQWTLSARRARAVADFIRSAADSHSKWPVYSWGAGPGGEWVAEDGPISGRSQILIAVLRAND